MCQTSQWMDSRQTKTDKSPPSTTGVPLTRNRRWDRTSGPLSVQSQSLLPGAPVRGYLPCKQRSLQLPWPRLRRLRRRRPKITSRRQACSVPAVWADVAHHSLFLPSRLPSAMQPPSLAEMVAPRLNSIPIAEAVSRKVRTSRSGSCEMNSVMYLQTAGITPAAPLVGALE